MEESNSEYSDLKRSKRQIISWETFIKRYCFTEKEKTRVYAIEIGIET